jgi:hypothetical protein
MLYATLLDQLSLAHRPSWPAGETARLADASGGHTSPMFR